MRDSGKELFMLAILDFLCMFFVFSASHVCMKFRFFFCILGLISMFAIFSVSMLTDANDVASAKAVIIIFSSVDCFSGVFVTSYILAYWFYFILFISIQCLLYC